MGGVIAVAGWVNLELAAAHSLTPRQIDVLAGMAKGWTNPTIARHMRLSEDTVKTHIKSVLRNLHVDCRTAAVAMAYDLGVFRTRAQRVEQAQAAGLRVVA